MPNTVNWFEIPVVNLDRAAAFYDRLLQTTLRKEIFGKYPMAIFQSAKDGVGGAILLDPMRKPSTDGTLVYLDARGDLDGSLRRAADMHAEVILPRTDIGEPGFIAILRDSEGNLVGLHQPR
jgi:predicted enzyme related to lactoylglutathione lyase